MFSKRNRIDRTVRKWVEMVIPFEYFSFWKNEFMIISIFSFRSLAWCDLFLFHLRMTLDRNLSNQNSSLFVSQVNLFYVLIQEFWWRKINKQTKGALRNWIETLLEKTNHLNHLLLNINEFTVRCMLMIAFKL